MLDEWEVHSHEIILSLHVFPQAFVAPVMVGGAHLKEVGIKKRKKRKNYARI